MNITKKLTALIVILGLSVLSFILYSTKMGSNTATTTASSVMSKATEVMSKMTPKDNKTIELLPTSPEKYVFTENKFDTTSVTPAETIGFNGSRIYNNQAGSTYIKIANSTSPLNDLTKNELTKFKTAIASKGDVVDGGIFGLTSIFRGPVFNGGYAKKFVKDITITKPANFDSLRAIITMDGQSPPLNPTVNLIGNRGNDYFFIESIPKEFNVTEAYAKAQSDCANDVTNACIDGKYLAAINALFTDSFNNTEVLEAIALLN